MIPAVPKRAAALLLTVCINAANAAPAIDALDRPAIAARRPAKAVLSSATIAGSRLVAAGERGLILLSDDRGRNWRQAKSVPVSVALTSVRFVDGQHGFAVGHGGVVLGTSDSGETWRRLLDGKQAALLALSAAKAKGDPQTLKEAERLVADGADKPLLDLHFFDANRGLVIGAYNLAFETNDGGRTWRSSMDRLDNPKGLHLYAVRAAGPTVTIVGEAGLVLRSDDGGQTFRRLPTRYDGSYFTVETPSTNEIVIAGLRGNAWRSVDAGASWSQIASPAPVSITGSAIRNEAGGAPGIVFVNQAGMVLELRGNSLIPLPLRPQAPLSSVVPLAGGALLTTGFAGVVTQQPNTAAAGNAPANAPALGASR